MSEFVLVPREPTAEMAFAGIHAVTMSKRYDKPGVPGFDRDRAACNGDTGAVRAMQSYRAMIAAAPKCATDPDAIWNEAIEAAALKMEELAGDWKREKQIAYAHALFIEAKAIRALKRQQGGGNSLPLGTRVRKTRGSSWQGRIVGTYSTSLTPEGYAVESEREPGSVQIYPRCALEVINV